MSTRSRSSLPRVLHSRRVVWPAALIAIVLTTAVVASVVASGEQRRERIEYVALGDSYTSAPWVPPTDADDPCLRSKANYPHLLAKAISRIDLVDVSCGGATTGDMTGAQKLRSASRPPQLDALSKDTDLVTLSIGANNDDLFAKLIYACFPTVTDGEACHTASVDKETLQKVIDEIQTDVERVVEAIRERSPKSQIIIVNYPQMVTPTSACPDRWPFGAADTAYIADANTRFSTALTSAASAADVESVDVLPASAGHDICAEEPWVQGATTDTAAAASFHPLAVEQQAVAALVQDAICNELSC